MFTNSTTHQHAGQVLSNSFKLYTSSLLKILPFSIILTLLMVGEIHLSKSINTSGYTGFEIRLALNSIIGLLNVFVMAYCILIFQQLATGNTFNLAEITKRIMSRYVTIICAFIIMFVLKFVGFILGGFGSIMLSVYLMPVLIVGLLHNDSATHIIKHAFRITYRCWWQTFFVLFLPFVVTYICSAGAGQTDTKSYAYIIGFFLFMPWYLGATYCQYINLQNRPITDDHSKFMNALADRPRSLVHAAWLTTAYVVIIVATVLIDLLTKANILYFVQTASTDPSKLHALYSHVFSIGLVVGIVVTLMCYTFYGSWWGRIFLILAAILTAIMFGSHAITALLEHRSTHMSLLLVHGIVAIINLAIAYLAFKNGHWSHSIKKIFEQTNNEELHQKAAQAESE